MSATQGTWRLALPMYNVTPALGRLWEDLLAHIIDTLRRRGWQGRMEVTFPDDLLEFWRAPDLLLSQTCGYPLVNALDTGVQVLAAAEFDLPGCDGFLYCSNILVPQAGAQSLESLRGAVAVINQHHSQSGMNALRHAVAPLSRGGRFFSRVEVSGGHLASMAMLQRGQADVAAVDCATFALAQRHAPDAVAGLRVLQTTQPTPGLPLITSCQLTDLQAADLRDVVLGLGDSAPGLLSQLSIRRFHGIALADYAAIRQQEQFAVDRGYPVLA